MRGEPYSGWLAKPERRVTVKKRAQRLSTLSRAQCKQKVYARERMHCERCGLKLTLECYPPDPRYPHVNERVPRSQGGDPHEPKNCELLCGTCHMPNGQHAPTQARMKRLRHLSAEATRLKRASLA